MTDRSITRYRLQSGPFCQLASHSQVSQGTSDGAMVACLTSEPGPMKQRGPQEPEAEMPGAGWLRAPSYSPHPLPDTPFSLLLFSPLPTPPFMPPS